MTDATHYSVPKEPGRWRALALAAGVHAALLAFLWIGVRWQNDTPATIEAEVWSPQFHEAAPRPQPIPEPQPEPEQKPAPEPKPAVREPVRPTRVEPPVVKPDIALEQEKKRKAKEQKLREEQERIEKQQAEKKRLEQEKLAEAKKKADEQKKLEADKKRIEQEKEKVADAAKKADAEKKRKQALADKAAADKAHDETLKRLMAQAGTGGSGDAPKTQGSRGDGGYGEKIRAKIRSNTVFAVPDNLRGNPDVEYDVELLPDGSVSRIRKVKSSGVPGFDEAVWNAIEKSQPFPRDKSGKVPSALRVVHKPKDQ